MIIYYVRLLQLAYVVNGRDGTKEQVQAEVDLPGALVRQIGVP